MSSLNKTLIKNTLMSALSLGLLVFTPLALAGEIKVRVDQARIRSLPSRTAPSVMKAKRGQTFTTDGTQQDGFLKLQTRSGRSLWVASSDVEGGQGESGAEAEAEVANDLGITKEAGANPRKQQPEFRRWTFDIQGASNLSNQRMAYEAHLGVNYHFTSWLIWRNSPFYRYETGLASQFGLDTSIKGQQSFSLAPEFSPSASVGAGYRLINTGAHAPFVEGGVSARVQGLSVGANVKAVFNSVARPGASTELIYGVQFSGSASF
jgi:hypothetical protein